MVPTTRLAAHGCGARAGGPQAPAHREQSGGADRSRDGRRCGSHAHPLARARRRFCVTANRDLWSAQSRGAQARSIASASACVRSELSRPKLIASLQNRLAIKQRSSQPSHHHLARNPTHHPQASCKPTVLFTQLHTKHQARARYPPALPPHPSTRCSHTSQLTLISPPCPHAFPPTSHAAQLQPKNFISPQPLRPPTHSATNLHRITTSTRYIPPLPQPQSTNPPYTHTLPPLHKHSTSPTNTTPPPLTPLPLARRLWTGAGRRPRSLVCGAHGAHCVLAPLDPQPSRRASETPALRARPRLRTRGPSRRARRSAVSSPRPSCAAGMGFPPRAGGRR